MSAAEEVVYFEDIESSSRSNAASRVDSAVVTKTEGASSQANASKTTVTGVKRQLTLADMFSTPSTQPSSKRLKASASSSSLNSSPSRSNATVFGIQKLNSIPFSMKAFQESLDEEQTRLLRLECDVLGKSWLKVLKEEIKQPYFIALKRFLWNEGVREPEYLPRPLKVYPSPRDIYSWSETPLGKVKVVIIGQDPYPGPNQAHGLCFSVRMGVAIPPSLLNIYAEIKNEYPEFIPPKHGNLAVWASAGVLLLNSSLTVEARKANSHSDKGWERFTDKVIDVVDKWGGASIKVGLDGQASGIGRGVVFLAWGAFAEKRVARLNKNKHLILKSAHPSPKSAHRGFLGNGHFKAANDWLEEKYGPDGRVDWCKLEPGLASDLKTAAQIAESA
ncbi:uracil-DNA glycosylase-like protein [Lentinula detonsa]|uniref:Uracil-DNA glycosylase n=1 Tax=Lentinula detonsa TaxID=2804962 RepID=A0AA38QA75_9AGAR|nr:uracil-DNA glycosylase-like protein [Lentinula detonsa]